MCVCVYVSCCVGVLVGRLVPWCIGALVRLFCFVLCCVVLCCFGLGWVGLGWVGWLVGWLVLWLVGSLVGWLIGSLVHLFVCFVGPMNVTTICCVTSKVTAYATTATLCWRRCCVFSSPPQLPAPTSRGLDSTRIEP